MTGVQKFDVQASFVVGSVAFGAEHLGPPLTWLDKLRIRYPSASAPANDDRGDWLLLNRTSGGFLSLRGAVQSWSKLMADALRFARQDDAEAYATVHCAATHTMAVQC